MHRNHNIIHPNPPLHSQNILQQLLLMRRQASRILNLNLHNHIPSLRRLSTLRHALMRERFLEAGPRRPATGNDLLPAVDGGNGTAPACEGFFEVEFDYRFEVVAVAGEDGVGFLCGMLVYSMGLDVKGEKLASVTMKCRSCVPPSSWSPMSLNLIFVPALYPGLMSISSILSSTLCLCVLGS